MSKLEKYKDCILPVIGACGVIIDQRYYKYNQDKKIYEVEYETQVYPNLYETFTDIINYNFYYSFNVKNHHFHGHSFDEVIRELYYNPETFNIDEEDKYLYSEQELTFLRRLKNLLVLVGLKDIDAYDEKKLILRAKNKKLKKLMEYRPLKLNNTASFVINGNRKNIITKFYNATEIGIDGKYIILNSNDNYLGIVETKK